MLNTNCKLMEAIFGRPQILNALRSPPLAKVIKALFDKWTITVRMDSCSIIPNTRQMAELDNPFWSMATATIKSIIIEPNLYYGTNP
ncbi:hypothetical protein BLOT_014701 [Blomia tropicalis]|nr:hypothetical protein BLOT_014701 [Blomia tropicalis]